MSQLTSEPAIAPELGVGDRKKFWFDSRYIAPLFITCILLVGHLSYGILESYERTALAIVAAIVTELVLGRIFFGKWLNLASAYITGISVGILVRSPAFWPYALCSVISIMSKYVLRVKVRGPQLGVPDAAAALGWKRGRAGSPAEQLGWGAIPAGVLMGRHLWNPSNFGICVLLFLAPETVASLSIQWGNYIWPMLVIWVLGSIIIWRARRFHISATYVVSFFVFAFLRSWITGDPWQSEIAPITGPMYQLFVFFMVTDPKTTVKSKLGQCFVVFCVALVEMLLRLNHVVYAPFYALFLAGPPAMLIDIWLESRRARAVQAVA